MATAKPWGHMVMFGFTILAIVYVLVLCVKNMLRYNQYKNEHAQIYRTYTTAVALNRDYNEQLRGMQKPGYWEDLIATRLGYVRQGEDVYWVLEPSK